MAKFESEPGSEEFLRHAQLQRRWRRTRALKRLGIAVAFVVFVVGGWLSLTRPWEWQTVPFRVQRVEGSNISVSQGCSDHLRATIVRETDEIIEIKAEIRNPQNDCLGVSTVEADRSVDARTIIDHSTGEAAHLVSTQGS